jgi:hypothetical protein
MIAIITILAWAAFIGCAVKYQLFPAFVTFVASLILTAAAFGHPLGVMIVSQFIK